MVQRGPLRFTYVVFCVEIGAEFEKRARDVTLGGFACIMKRRSSCYLEEFQFHTTRKWRLITPLLTGFTPQNENEPCSLRWDLGQSSQGTPRPTSDLQMTRNAVRSFHSGDITAPSTQQHPSDPRHVHRQVLISATRRRIATNHGSRIGISAGFEEQLHDRQMTF
jgi:hypothetical protein